MTTLSRDAVLAHFIDLLHSMADEWAEPVHLTEDSLVMGNMNWRSIELVYIANALQMHYGRVFPFESLIKGVEARGDTDIRVREWVDFIVATYPDAPPVPDDASASA